MGPDASLEGRAIGRDFSAKDGWSYLQRRALVTQHYAMLQRNLLYTGVTRGKRLVVLVGQKKAVAIAVRNVSGRRRWSKGHHLSVAAIALLEDDVLDMGRHPGRGPGHLRDRHLAQAASAPRARTRGPGNH